MWLWAFFRVFKTLYCKKIVFGKKILDTLECVRWEANTPIFLAAAFYLAIRHLSLPLAVGENKLCNQIMVQPFPALSLLSDFLTGHIHGWICLPIAASSSLISPFPLPRTPHIHVHTPPPYARASFAPPHWFSTQKQRTQRPWLTTTHVITDCATSMLSSEYS